MKKNKESRKKVTLTFVNFITGWHKRFSIGNELNVLYFEGEYF